MHCANKSHLCRQITTLSKCMNFRQRELPRPYTCTVGSQATFVSQWLSAWLLSSMFSQRSHYSVHTSTCFPHKS